MASSLFGPKSPQPQTTPQLKNNGGNLLQQFAQFKKTMQGKNPEQIVKQMLSDGRMTQGQFEQLKKQADSLMTILR